MRRLSALFGLTFCLLPSGALWSQSYTAQVLTASGCTTSNFYIYTMNNANQVLASCGAQIYIMSTSGNTPISPPSAYPAYRAESLNDLGQVTGWSGNSTVTLPFIATSSSSTVLPTLPNTDNNTGFDINNSGQVTGYGSVLGQTESISFIGNASGVTALPLPSGISYVETYAINSSGQTTGYAAGTATYEGQGQPFIGTTSGVTVIPIPTGWYNLTAYGINSSGTVVGYGQGPSQGLAFVATPTSFTPIPAPSSGSGNCQVSQNPHGINDSGAVTGYCEEGNWVWTASSGTVALAPGVNIPTGTQLYATVAINNSGAIVAYGYLNSQYGAVLLTPSGGTHTSPPPASAPALSAFAFSGLALLLAAVGLAVMRRARIA